MRAHLQRFLLPSQIAAAAARGLARVERAVATYEIAPSTREFLNGAGFVVAAFISSRLIIFSVMMLSRTVMVPAAWWHPGGLLSVLTQWDGELWYIQIARHGYYIRSGEYLPHNFWPFYPILIKLASIVFRDLRVAAVVISHVCLLLGGLCLNALIRVDYKDPRVSRTAVMLFMFSPVSFFFSNAYTESTFFLLATGAFLAARKGNWLVASLFGMCLSATRQVGILIALPLFLEFLRQFWTRERGFRGLLHPRILFLALIPCGIGAHMLYCHVAFGDAFMFSKAASAWGRSFTSPVETILFLRTYTRFYYIFFLSALIVTLAILLAGVFFRIRATYLLYATMLTAIYLCSKTFEAFPRYVSVEFPLFIILGLIAARYKWTYEPLFVGTVALLTLCSILSANGYWMT